MCHDARNMEVPDMDRHSQGRRRSRKIMPCYEDTSDRNRVLFRVYYVHTNSMYNTSCLFNSIYLLINHLSLSCTSTSPC